MIAIFKVAYWFVAILQFIFSVAAIIALGVERAKIIDACAAYADETVESCSVGYRNFMIIFCVVVMVVNFIQVCVHKQYKPRVLLILIAFFI
jgi:hypothetical protein